MGRILKLKRIFKRDGDKCAYCGVKLHMPFIGLLPIATIDHYIPRAAGGKDNIENLRAACKRCNQAKDDTIPKKLTRGERKLIKQFKEGQAAK